MTSTEVHNSYPGAWETFLGVVTAVVSLAVFLSYGFSLWQRLVAIGAVAAIVVLHLVWGRAVIRGERGNVPLLAAELALFAVAIVTVPVMNWLLFAMIPLIFQMVHLRAAVIAIVAIVLVPPVADLFLRPQQIIADLIIAVISAASGIWLGFWITRVIEQSIERRQLIADLEASRTEIARLSREAERTHLAAEIHDTLAQGFTSIITLLQSVDPALRDERLALAVRTAKENLAEARALVGALSPSPLASASLPEAVRRQASRFAEESGVPATFRTSGDERTLPTAVEVVLLRAAQEALTNVRRHAEANEASVLLAYTPSCVRLVVRDDGQGFVPSSADGFGLSGMRQRATQINGDLRVRSTPEAGTTIELEVPA
ncbi:sensor histidine kinase [Paractinoplanes atraurantiacus]|uniref:histidine kinase n=1 Tax=Paractinoplanes atraurantiacus TaxID=1036182 RepID=A0A285JCK1_9ACTN|nr:sensor histidine kinase [Actinoplanes atraurantiacus]SNY56891.1 Signal transduction histidine kinase [Actinoplanes atraurantiacus]